MTPSPDLLHELRAARPTASPALRARVRETAAAAPSVSLQPWKRLRFPALRVAAVAVPAAVALALVSAGAIGLTRSELRTVFSDAGGSVSNAPNDSLEAAPLPGSALGVRTQDSANAPTTTRARPSATARHVSRRVWPVSSECQRAGLAPNRSSNRASHCAESAISGKSTSA